jgi:N-dimethylarginine dimethylaminohydrolase
MQPRPLFLMTEPAGFEVSYQINPWMQPATWRADPAACRSRALEASAALRRALIEAGAQVGQVGAVKGLPDLVFPANAAVVLDGRVLLARFRCPERQGEEAIFRTAFTRLQRRGLVGELIDLPEGLFLEGAGDAIWDAGRGLFWTGYGQRSSRGALSVLGRVFGQPVVGLELASPRFYHLDTCFCPVRPGHALVYLDAFAPADRDKLRELLGDGLIALGAEEANTFVANSVVVDDTFVTHECPPRLRRALAELGLAVQTVDVGEFGLSGGSVRCLTLPLDLGPRPGGTS